MESYPYHPDRNLTSDSEIKINIQHVPTISNERIGYGFDNEERVSFSWLRHWSFYGFYHVVTLSWRPRILMRLAHQWLHVLQIQEARWMIGLGWSGYWKLLEDPKVSRWISEKHPKVRSHRRSEFVAEIWTMLIAEIQKRETVPRKCISTYLNQLVSLYKMLGEYPWTHQSPWNAALFRPLRHCHCTERDATVAWAPGEGKALKHGVTGVMMKLRINVNDCQRRRMAVQYWICHPHRWEQSFGESNIVLQFLQYIRIRLMKEWWKKGLTRYRFFHSHMIIWVIWVHIFRQCPVPHIMQIGSKESNKVTALGLGGTAARSAAGTRNTFGRSRRSSPKSVPTNFLFSIVMAGCFLFRVPLRS